MFNNHVHEINLCNDYRNPAAICVVMGVLVRNLSAISDLAKTALTNLDKRAIEPTGIGDLSLLLLSNNMFG